MFPSDIFHFCFLIKHTFTYITEKVFCNFHCTHASLESNLRPWLHFVILLLVKYVNINTINIPYFSSEVIGEYWFSEKVLSSPNSSNLNWVITAFLEQRYGTLLYEVLSSFQRISKYHTFGFFIPGAHTFLSDFKAVKISCVRECYRSLFPWQ